MNRFSTKLSRHFRSPALCRRPRPAKTAFTLVELLVVIGIIGILIGLLFPALSAVRQAARKSYCSSNMRQIILAALSHESTHLTFPAGDNGEGGSFMVALLPYFKQEYLVQLEASDLESGQTYQDRLAELAEIEVEILICPSASPSLDRANIADTGDYTTHYYGISGPTGTAEASDGSKVYNYDVLSPISISGPIGLQGMFSPNESGQYEGLRLNDIRDGASYTLGIGECSGSEALDRAGWSYGVEYDSSDSVTKTFGIKSMTHAINSFDGELNNFSFNSNHPSGSQFAYIDGAVRYIDEKVSVDVLKTICSIDEVEKPEDLDEF